MCRGNTFAYPGPESWNWRKSQRFPIEAPAGAHQGLAAGRASLTAASALAFGPRGRFDIEPRGPHVIRAGEECMKTQAVVRLSDGAGTKDAE